MSLVRLVRDLRRRKARERRGLVLVEGLRLVEDALDANARCTGVLAADDAAPTPDGERLLAAARSRGIPVETVPRRDFDMLADTATPSGVLGVVEWEPLTLERLPAPGPNAVALVLDGIQDPGNVGTMIRTARALGAWCSIALDGTADVRNPKVVRGAMGSHFRHPVAEADWDAFATWAAQGDLALYVAAADGTPAVGTSARPRALVIGSEGHGARDAWTRLEHRRIAIPMAEGADSLNAAVAAGILLHELTRVR